MEAATTTITAAAATPARTPPPSTMTTRSAKLSYTRRVSTVRPGFYDGVFFLVCSSRAPRAFVFFNRACCRATRAPDLADRRQSSLNRRRLSSHIARLPQRRCWATPLPARPPCQVIGKLDTLSRSLKERNIRFEVTSD